MGWNHQLDTHRCFSWILNSRNVSRYWWSYVMFCDPRNFHWVFSKMNILGHPESQWVSLSLHDCDSWDLRGTMRNVWNGWKLKHPRDLLGMGYIEKGSKIFVFLEVLGLSDTTCSMCFWCKMQAKRRPSFCLSSLAKPEFLQWFLMLMILMSIFTPREIFNGCDSFTFLDTGAILIFYCYRIREHGNGKIIIMFSILIHFQTFSDGRFSIVICCHMSMLIFITGWCNPQIVTCFWLHRQGWLRAPRVVGSWWLWRSLPCQAKAGVALWMAA